ncbi:ABC transporter permease [Streptomyces sp. TRM66268-LWL]|uniref:ABC transporter permease n=1 Tax=Streptomyces polyasparticus TaxID=2767826 RepID=A0ABR7SRB7_9ACTN|nr:ABC transporter permease [Streptomyces polyasparticus]MBC9718055.1 ABC transporter permease [Streptomyces polyasparticus]
MKTRAVAPWVRTRLKAAPTQALALALLVLVTAFLAAVFPRAVDTYETEGLHRALADGGLERSGIEISMATGEYFAAAPEQAVDAELTRRYQPHILDEMKRPLHPDRSEIAQGAQTSRPKTALDPWLPRPQAKPPEFVISTQDQVDRHARVVAGRLPQGKGITAASKQAEAAVTVATAKTLKIKVGSVLHFPVEGGKPVGLKITGLVEPLNPQGSYWSFDPTLRTPSLAVTPPSLESVKYWQAGLLLAPDAATILLAIDPNPQVYWRVPIDVGGLGVPDLPAVEKLVASLENGPATTRLHDAIAPTVSVNTELDSITAEFTAARTAITPVVSVAVFGIGAVALVVLLMTAALTASRRTTEITLLRARGGSVRGITTRICAETAVVAVPAAALGWWLATLVRPDGRLIPSVAGAAAVALIACSALPVRAVVGHLRLRAHGGREDLIAAKPSRRRTVAELTVLVLAVGAVAALRRRGSDDADGLISAAPVMVALIAALLLVRLYPLPIRFLSRPLMRRRGAIGFLSLARAGRTSAAQALPLLALLVALTTAAFGGSVIAGIADARDEAALQTVGADVRVNAQPNKALPEDLADKLRAVDGIREVSPVYIDANMRMPDGGKEISLIAVDPESYARLSGRTGLGAFSAGELKASGSGALPALASADAAKRLGRGEHELRSIPGDFTAKVTGVLETTPASFGAEFLLIDVSALPEATDSALFATGSDYDRTQLSKAVATAGPSVAFEQRTDQRATLSDSPLQSGAETVYGFAVAAGAGYAVLAVLLSLLQSAPERTALVARLRTMGLGKGQARRLLVLEALPQALLAAAGGALVALAAMELISPGLDLGRIALAAQAEVFGGARLRMDPWSLLVPAGAVVLLAVSVALAQAWWTARQTSLTELRAGDAR